ncbi:Pyridoxal 5'-phosphate synthase-like subunit PDX1.2, partial [Bienertia sinuspersici]
CHFLLLCQCGLAKILRGDAIIDVSYIRQAKRTKRTGASCIFIASDQKGSGRMADPSLMKEINMKIISSINIDLGFYFFVGQGSGELLGEFKNELH